MKAYNKIALAILTATTTAAASAGVTVTPILLGYHVSNDIKDTAKKQRGAFDTGNTVVLPETQGTRTSSRGKGVALDSDLYVGAGIGIELTPTIALELEYGEKSTDAYANKDAQKVGSRIGGGTTDPADPTYDANKATVDSQANSYDFDAKQKMYSANFTVGTETFTGYTNNKLKPYVLVGGGVSDIKIKNKYQHGSNAPGEKEVSSKDTIGNLGLGAYYRINDTLSLRGEARAIHNFDRKWWEGMALAGLNVVLGGHLAPKAQVVEPTIAPVTPVEAPVETIAPVVVAEGDSDQDGVLDSLDLCPNTPYNYVVDANGCPVTEIEEDQLRMELRVFFDNDKTIIKEQYRPEIRKVAEKMAEYPNATASIEGHASKNTKRSSAKYNQRLSEARANAVKGMLVNQFGVNPARISTVGYGFDRPIADNATKEGQAMNRRVYATISGNKTQTVTKTKDIQ